MVKNLRKTAAYSELPYNHQGIFNPDSFQKHVRLRCYAPSADMAPFVALYFVARYAVPSRETYTVSDVLTQPVANLFFTEKRAYINGVTTKRRIFRLHGTGLYAGVKFKAGGFHAFYENMAAIAENSVPITDVFPNADASFHRTLLSLTDDQAVVMQLEYMLRTKSPQPDPAIARITEMITAIENDQRLRTVATVARAYHMSERTLQQLFQTYVGVGIKWVIMRARFLEAVQHAYMPEKPNWTEISISLGYSTPSHFTNDFKKIVGMPPSRYVALQNLRRCIVPSI